METLPIQEVLLSFRLGIFTRLPELRIQHPTIDFFLFLDPKLVIRYLRFTANKL